MAAACLLRLRIHLVAPLQPSQALLLRLFGSFPAPVLDMIAATPPASLLEAAVLTRPARSLPNCLGRGGVVVLGEAAHPLRPSGAHDELLHSMLNANDGRAAQLDLCSVQRCVQSCTAATVVVVQRIHRCVPAMQA
jgi:hypothetical protein